MPGSLQQEIKQSKPFASLEEEVYLALQVTADRLARRGAAFLKQHQLSPAQYNTLRILRGAGSDGLPCSEIGERMINRDPDITRMLDRLEKRGLVQRCRDDKDRRVVTARISAEGRSLLRRLDAPVREFQKQLLGQVGTSRLTSLLQLLEGIRQSAQMSR